MKVKKKTIKVGKKARNSKNMEDEIKTPVEETSAPEVVVETPLPPAPEPTPGPVVKVARFSGDFGRADIDLLRDKVNEVIDFINK